MANTNQTIEKPIINNDALSNPLSSFSHSKPGQIASFESRQLNQKQNVNYQENSINDETKYSNINDESIDKKNAGKKTINEMQTLSKKRIFQWRHPNLLSSMKDSDTLLGANCWQTIIIAMMKTGIISADEADFLNQPMDEQICKQFNYDKDTIRLAHIIYSNCTDNKVEYDYNIDNLDERALDIKKRVSNACSSMKPGMVVLAGKSAQHVLISCGNGLGMGNESRNNEPSEEMRLEKEFNEIKDKLKNDKNNKQLKLDRKRILKARIEVSSVTEGIVATRPFNEIRTVKLDDRVMDYLHTKKACQNPTYGGMYWMSVTNIATIVKKMYKQ